MFNEDYNDKLLLLLLILLLDLSFDFYKSIVPHWRRPHHLHILDSMMGCSTGKTAHKKREDIIKDKSLLYCVQQNMHHVSATQSCDIYQLFINMGPVVQRPVSA